MDWKAAQEITGTIQNAFASAAVVVAGVWAYYRFIRFRTLKPRLEFGFDWRRSDRDDSRSIGVLTVTLTNKGQREIALRNERVPRSYLKFAVIPDHSAAQPVSLVNVSPKRFEHLDVLFAPHRWIEPGETIDDVKVLSINRDHVIAVQFEAVVFGVKKWSAGAAFALKGDAEGDSSSSEDEQDDYTEAAMRREGLKNVLVRIGRLEPPALAQMRAVAADIERLLGASMDEDSFVREAKRLEMVANDQLASLE